MTKRMFILTALLCMCFAACLNEDDGVKSPSKPGDTPQGGESLVGTKWQLTAFVDVENNTKTPPKECWDPDRPSYFIAFEVNDSIDARSGNYILGNYHIYDNSNKMSILVHLGSYAMGCPDQDLYIESLNKVEFFIVKKGSPDILQLFYNDGKNYLEFNTCEVFYEID